MRTISDHLGAWIVVGALALAVATVWDGETSQQQQAGLDPLVCGDHAVAGATLPRAVAWRPNPVHTGTPDETSQALSSYELDEERDLARLNRTSVEPVGALAGYGSSTSLKPIRMC